jgi:hypothetical protein
MGLMKVTQGNAAPTKHATTTGIGGKAMKTTAGGAATATSSTKLLGIKDTRHGLFCFESIAFILFVGLL